MVVPCRSQHLGHIALETRRTIATSPSAAAFATIVTRTYLKITVLSNSVIPAKAGMTTDSWLGQRINFEIGSSVVQ
jgi:hypothetical protein